MTLVPEVIGRMLLTETEVDSLEYSILRSRQDKQSKSRKYVASSVASRRLNLFCFILNFILAPAGFQTVMIVEETGFQDVNRIELSQEDSHVVCRPWLVILLALPQFLCRR